jgi:hypothetical protein
MSESAAYRALVPAWCSRAAAGRCLDKNLDQRPIEASGRSVAPITGPKVDRPWGIYSGYFRDFDGHLCEVIWNSEVPPAS